MLLLVTDFQLLCNMNHILFNLSFKQNAIEIQNNNYEKNII